MTKLLTAKKSEPAADSVPPPAKKIKIEMVVDDVNVDSLASWLYNFGIQLLDSDRSILQSERLSDNHISIRIQAIRSELCITIKAGSHHKGGGGGFKKRLCVFSFFWLNFILLECFHFILVPKYSSFQELSNDMFYKGIASTMTHIGPQRVTPLGALLKII